MQQQKRKEEDDDDQGAVEFRKRDVGMTVLVALVKTRMRALLAPNRQ